MKKTLLHLILFFLSFNAFSQVGINTTSPNAQLDIASSNQATPSNTDGILIPKIDAFPATNPTAAQQGMMVYLTTTVAGKQPGFYYWDDTITSWTNIGTDNAWKLLGNTGTTAANFIGTTDDVPLQLKVNNEKAGAITSAGLVFFGYQAGNVNTGTFNTGVGSQALFSNTSGINNSAYGSRALYSNTTGTGNTSNGVVALYSNTLGSNNTATGEQALYSNIAGTYNTATGRRSLRSNTSGDYNAAHGFQALYTNAAGTRNTANGAFALYLNISGNYNTATGMNALYGNSTGINNTANGYQALFNSGGNNNTGIGYQALNVNTTGNDNTAIGMNAGPNVNNLTNTTSLGFNTSVTASNMVRVGNAAVTSIGGQVGWTTVSDGRFKENVEENVPGLNFIKLLRPVTYRLNRDKVNEMLGIKEPATDKYSITTTGFIAQEVEKAAKVSNFEFSGVDKPKNEKDFYGLRYAEFVVPLVKAVQDQQGIIVQEQEKNKLLQAEIKTLKENQKVVEERLKAIEEKLNK